MKKSVFQILALLISALVACATPEYSKDVSTWSVVQHPPKSDRGKCYDFWMNANYSDHSWVVQCENGKVTASLEEDSKPKSDEVPTFDTTVKLQDSEGEATLFLRVDDGWIAAYDKGEFGRSVYWFNEDGSQRRKLSDHQINEFIIDEKRIFAVEGLSHLGSSRGSMIELRKEKEKWLVDEFISLPESAEAIAQVSSGDYVLVTRNMILRINIDKQDKQLNILVPNGNWGILYPNSIAVGDDGFIYVGMRQFVIRCKLDKNVQDAQFLVPDYSWLNTNRELK